MCQQGVERPPGTFHDGSYGCKPLGCACPNAINGLRHSNCVLCYTMSKLLTCVLCVLCVPLLTIPGSTCSIETHPPRRYQSAIGRFQVASRASRFIASLCERRLP